MQERIRPHPEQPAERITPGKRESTLKRSSQEFMRRLTIILAAVTPFAERPVMAGDEPIREQQVVEKENIERVKAKIPGMNGEIFYVHINEGKQDFGERVTAELESTAVQRTEDPDPSIKGDETKIVGKILRWDFTDRDTLYEDSYPSPDFIGFDPDKNPFGRIGRSDYADVDTQLDLTWKRALTLQGLHAVGKGDTEEALFLKRAIEETITSLKKNNPKIESKIHDALSTILAPVKPKITTAALAAERAPSQAPSAPPREVAMEEARAPRAEIEAKAAVQFQYDTEGNITGMTVAGEIRGAAPETLLQDNWRVALNVPKPAMRNLTEQKLLSRVRQLAVQREALKTIESGTKEDKWLSNKIEQLEASIESMAKPGQSLLR